VGQVGQGTLEAQRYGARLKAEPPTDRVVPTVAVAAVQVRARKLYFVAQNAQPDSVLASLEAPTASALAVQLHRQGVHMLSCYPAAKPQKSPLSFRPSSSLLPAKRPTSCELTTRAGSSTSRYNAPTAAPPTASASKVADMTATSSRTRPPGPPSTTFTRIPSAAGWSIVPWIGPGQAQPATLELRTTSCKWTPPWQSSESVTNGVTDTPSFATGYQHATASVGEQLVA
jgi:hypothetical protein